MHPRFRVAQLGSRMHYAVPRILFGRGSLARCYTDVSVNVGWPRILTLCPKSLMPGGLRRLRDRYIPDVPGSLIKAFTGFGLEYQRRRAAARSASETTAVYLWAGERFCRLILDDESAPESDLYCFNSAGLELLRECRRLGRKGCVEQTIAPRRIEERVLGDEEQAFPGWIPRRPADSNTQGYVDREEAEWREADVILCGSEFVRTSVIACGGAAERCVTVPYGVSLEEFSPAPKAPVRGRPLRVLTIGEVGIRKGSHYVYQAARRLAGKAEFRMVGPIALLRRRADEVGRVVQLTGSVPRSQVKQHLDWADVFLLPSLCEGSATATYEALGAGLPVIATYSTGSIVDRCGGGVVVPERSVDAIVAALEDVLHDPASLRQMLEGTRAAAQYGSLEAYGDRLAGCLLT